MQNKIKNRNIYESSTQTFDKITGMLDRASFIHLLEAVLVEEAQSCIFGIANIENFKLINHSHGYKAGDYILNAIAKTMSLEFNKNTIIGRIGNDEFGFICLDQQIAQVQSTCESLNFSLKNAPLTWEAERIHLHIKFGLVSAKNQNYSFDQILKAASEAIHSVQHEGYSTVCEYNEQDSEMLRRNDKIEEAIKLQGWIAKNQLSLYLQPIVFLDNPEQASHFEVLLRGKPNNGEIISPAKFIEAAEDFNLTPLLDKWVIRNLFRWINENSSSNMPDSKFSLNISALSINDSDFSQYIISEAEKENITAKKINIEVTERVDINNIKQCYDFMTELNKIGFTFSLDDFGTGYCSFKYMQTLPFDVIKIDGTFIKDITTNRQNRIIVKSVNDIAKAYGKKTVAEYIENATIAKYVTDIGIDYGQGYYFSRPFPISHLKNWQAAAPASLIAENQRRPY